jgi:hypothetical protein
LEDEENFALNDAEELRKWGNEIEELRVRVNTIKAGSRVKSVNRLDELRVKIENARDNLIHTFYSLRSQD